MTITNLKEFVEDQVDSLESARDAAQADLLTKQDEHESKKSAHVEAVDDVMDLEKEIRDIRKDAAAALDAAEMEDLAAQLRTRTAELRAAETSRVSARDALNVAELDMKQADDLYTRLKSELRDAEAALIDETDRRDRLDLWIASLGTSPLDTLKADAEKVIAADDSGNGDSGNGDGGNGGNGDSGNGDGGSSDNGDGGSSDTGDGDTSDTVDDDRTAYQDAKKRVEDDIPVDLRLLATARRQLHMDAYTQAAQDLATTEDALAGDRETHEGKEGSVAKAALALDRAENRLGDYVHMAREKYDLAISLFTKVNASEPPTDAQKSEITDGATTVQERTIAVPDHIWDNFAEFYQAVDILEALSGFDPNSLPTNLDNAEQSLLTALTALSGAEEDMVEGEETVDYERKRFDYVAASVNEAIRLSMRTA